MKIKEKPVQKTFKKSSLKKTKTKISKKTKCKIKKPKKKVDLSKMNVDEFMSGGFAASDDDVNSDPDDDIRNKSDTEVQINESAKLKKQKKGSDNISPGKNRKKLKNGETVKLKKGKFKQNEAVEEEEATGQNEESGSDDDEDVILKHKKQLDGLKTTDPEFYNYLKEHDQDLLNFDKSDSDDEKEEMEVCHTAPESLEVASDESDFEPEEGGLGMKRSSRSVTMAMVTSWQQKLATTKNKKVLRDVIDAFHAAVLRVSTGDDPNFRFKVDGSSVFNAIIRMCVMDLHSGIKSFLRLEPDSKTPATQCKLWPKIKPFLKLYFEDLNELTGVTSASILTVLLKHIHQIVPFLVYFPNIAQRTVTRLVDLWSKSDDVVRVLAFLCLLRITNRSHLFLPKTLRKMYFTYVKNTKFVSPNVLPEINFMRQSLTEMLALDDTVTYHMAFVYIRQLAVHLRNAVTTKKKENFQIVYNWQYISSLQLWADLFGLVPDGSPLRTLVYPLTQIIIGTIKLIPSSQYYPLRFHCSKILINLSSKCGVFIPVLPFLLEVLQDFDFNREHKKLSMKPMDLTCLLRCSKLQMKENGFKDALMENINNLLIEYIASESHRISFPDVMVPAVMQLKQFVKQCKVVNYTKMVKALLEKITENSTFIENERKKLNFKLDDIKGVNAIEAGIKVKGTPFATYFESWKKVYLEKQQKKVVDNVKLGDYKLPVIYKLDKKRSREQSRSVGPPVLFPSDDESDVSLGLKDDSDSDDDGKKRKKKKRKVEKAESPSSKKEKKEKKPPVKKVKKEAIADDEVKDLDGNEDVIEDFRFSDGE